MTIEELYAESIRALEDLYHQPLLPAGAVGLQRTALLLDRIGNPQHAFHAVHVAGSSGKGSTTTMIGSILQSAGFRVGVFRSPHLQSYRERIAVNDSLIDRASWLHCFSLVWPVVEAMRRNEIPDYVLGRPALFEVLFAMMAVHFAEQHVDWAAVETGLGGRLDATNILQPDVAVVTNISLEHTHILGKNVREIAAEKAAIIKPGMIAVTASHDEEALDVIRTRADDVAVPLLRVGHEVTVEIIEASLSGQNILLRAENQEPLRLTLPLHGAFQADNAATAFATAIALGRQGVPVDRLAIRRGLESAHIPGRFEVVCRQPLVILDGAHNPAAAAELRRALESLQVPQPVVLVLAVMKDKDIRSIAQEFASVAGTIIATETPDAYRTARAEAVAHAFRAPEQRVLCEPDQDRALQIAREVAGPDGTIVVAGSLYLVGQLRSHFVSPAVPT